MGRYHALKPHHLYHSSTSTHPSNPLLQLKNSYSSSSALLQTSSLSALSALSVGDRIPGFKISAAFLSSLHANIFIEVDSAYGSPISTPNDLHSYAESLPSPFASSMSSLSAEDVAPPDALKFSKLITTKKTSEDDKDSTPTVGEDGLPILSTFSAEDEDTRAEALHIIADSIAQQRNIASRSVLYHPITVALLAIAIGTFSRTWYEGPNTDWIKIFMTSLGTIMAVLGAVRLVCGPYIFEAESVGTWKWLDKGRSPEEEDETGIRVLGKQDDILVTKFGEEYIGAIIFRGVQPILSPGSPSGSKKPRRTTSSSKQTRMIVRGWSVRQKYRRKEVGSALLENAIEAAKAKGWTADGVAFAEDHANHKRVLPAIFNGPLDKFTHIAQRTLDKQIQQFGITQDKGRRRK